LSMFCCAFLLVLSYFRTSRYARRAPGYLTRGGSASSAIMESALARFASASAFLISGWGLALFAASSWAIASSYFLSATFLRTCSTTDSAAKSEPASVRVRISFLWVILLDYNNLLYRYNRNLLQTRPAALGVCFSLRRGNLLDGCSRGRRRAEV